MICTYQSTSQLASPVLNFSTPSGMVTLSSSPTEVTTEQLEYLKEYYPEFNECVSMKIITISGDDNPEPQPALLPKRK